MKSLFVLASILVTACAGASAGTGTPLSLTTDHAPPPALVLSTEPAAQRSFPERVAPAKLPSADRAGLAGRLTAGVKLCVAPDGRVHSVAVEKSSGTPAFDQALTADVPSWQFAPYKAPTELKVCERVNITYVSH